MKTCNLSLATVVVGALAISYSACSAQGEDNSYPAGPVSHAGNSNASGGQLAGGGSPTVPSGTGGSVAHPAGGSASHAGGSFNTGVGGATTSGGRPGTAAGGSTTGGGGRPATSGGCAVTVGLATELLIDDLEDGDGLISGAGSRVGSWYTYNDGTVGATQVPAPLSPFKGKAPGSTATPKFAATTSGPKFTTWGAGMGFTFNNPGAKACPYNASAYKGIKFWAKSNTTAIALKAMIKIPGTTPTTADSGTCVASTTVKCEDHYYLKPAPMLTTAWAQYDLAFASAAQDGFGAVVPFDKASIIAMQFQVAMSVAFDISIDDLTFY